MSHDHCHSPSKPFSVDLKLKLSVLLLAAVWLASHLPFPVLGHLHHSLTGYIQLIWWAVLLGLFLGGMIDYFIPEAFIHRLLGGGSLRSIFFSVIAGFLLSACSHGILAIAIQLHKKGAGIASTVTFLLASPWANLPVTILLFGFFGGRALLFIGAAMLIAVVTGAVFLLLERLQWVESSPGVRSEETPNWEHIRNFSLRQSAAGVSSGALQLANMVLWWIIIGVLAAALIGAYVPRDVFANYFGPSLSGLTLTLLAATVIEVCSEGSSPIAFEIFNQVGTLGNPFVFLMAGVVTDYTEIGLLWSNIGKRTALWLPIITVPQVLLIGWLMNWV